MPRVGPLTPLIWVGRLTAQKNRFGHPCPLPDTKDMLASTILAIPKAIGRVRRNQWLGFMAVAWTLVLVNLVWITGPSGADKSLGFSALLLVGALTYTWGYMREGRREDREVQALTVGPPNQLALETSEIHSMYESGDVSNALRASESALAVRPEDPSLWCAWARCMAANGETRMATKGIDRALEHDPENVEALYLLAWSRRFYWDYRGARSAASAGLVVDPSHAGLRFELSEAKRMIHQWTRAKALPKRQPMSARSMNPATTPTQAVPQDPDADSSSETTEDFDSFSSFSAGVLELEASPVPEYETPEPAETTRADFPLLELGSREPLRGDDVPRTVEMFEQASPETSHAEPVEAVEAETELFDNRLFVSAVLDSEFSESALHDSMPAEPDHTETVPLDTAHFDSTDLGTSQPEVFDFDTTQPEVFDFDTSQPEVADLETAPEPETANLETAPEPETADLETPDFAAPEPETADFRISEVEAPADSVFAFAPPEAHEPTVSEPHAWRPIKQTSGSRLERLVAEANAACARIHDDEAPDTDDIGAMAGVGEPE